MDYELDLDGFDELIGALGTLYPQTVNDEVYDTLEMSMWAFHQAVDLETPVNFGTLRAANAVEITGTSVNLVGMLVNPLGYALPVERGRMPGRQPPTGPIELWVIRKLGIQPPESASVAYLIARSIGRKGTKGAAMFAKGFEVALPQVEQYWQGLPDRVVKRLE